MNQEYGWNSIIKILIIESFNFFPKKSLRVFRKKTLFFEVVEFAYHLLIKLIFELFLFFDFGWKNGGIITISNACPLRVIIVIFDKGDNHIL